MEIVSDFSTAKIMMKKYHYSHTCPVGRGFVAYDEDKVVVAAAVFGNTSGRYDWSGNFIELKRLVKVPGNDSYPLTSFISRCCSLLTALGEDLVVSYADPAQGHFGGIYQAASWNYHGMSVKGTQGFLIDGVYHYRRNLFNTYGTSSYKRLQALLPDAKVVHVRSSGKYLYWKVLNKRGKQKAKRFGFRSVPYPQPNKVVDTHEDS